MHIPDSELSTIATLKRNNNNLLQGLPPTTQKKIVELNSHYPNKFQQISLLFQLGRKRSTFYKVLSTTPASRKYIVWQAAKLFILTKAKNITLVHTEFARTSANICYIAHKIFDIPYTLTVHGYDLREPLTDIDKILENATYVFCPSKFHKANVEQLVGKKLDTAIVSYLGINIQTYYQPQHQLSEPMNMLCVARLHPIKNHQFLLLAFSQVKRQMPKAQLVLAGGGELEPELRQFVKTLKLEKQVQFVGEVNRAQVIELLKVADTFVLPSKAEGLSISAIEAAASGLAIITTDVGGMNELVLQDETGMLVESDNIEQLANTLLELYLSPSTRLKLANNAREFCIKNFDKKVCFEKQLSCWKNI